MNLENLVHQYHKNLNDLDRVVIQYIMNHTDTISNMSIVDVANATHVSKSSVLRTTKRLGFSGYSEFKYFLRQANKPEEVEQETNILVKQKNDIMQTLVNLGAYDLEPIYQSMNQAETIYCFGTGHTQQHAMSEFSKMMFHMEKKVMIIPSKNELDMVMPMITENDLIVIASLSGETEEVKQNLTTLKFRNVPVLTITAMGDNFFARNSTYHLNYYCEFFTIGARKVYAQSLIGLNVLVDYLLRGFGVYTMTNSEDED